MTQDFKEQLVLAISEHHSGDGTEASAIAQAIIDHLTPMMKEVVDALETCCTPFSSRQYYDQQLVDKALAAIPDVWKTQPTNDKQG